MVSLSTYRVLQLQHPSPRILAFRGLTSEGRKRVEGIPSVGRTGLGDLKETLVTVGTGRGKQAQ